MEKQFLARWLCPECGATKCGYIGVEDYAHRYCAGIPKRVDVRGEHCCHEMQIVHDDRPSWSHSEQDYPRTASQGRGA